jgi:hypothetical protein
MVRQMRPASIRVGYEVSRTETGAFRRVRAIAPEAGGMRWRITTDTGSLCPSPGRKLFVRVPGDPEVAPSDHRPGKPCRCWACRGASA